MKEAEAIEAAKRQAIMFAEDILRDGSFFNEPARFREAAQIVARALLARRTEEEVIVLDAELVRKFSREMCARFGYATASWQGQAEFVRRIMRAALTSPGGILSPEGRGTSDDKDGFPR